MFKKKNLPLGSMLSNTSQRQTLYDIVYAVKTKKTQQNSEQNKQTKKAADTQT